MSPEPDRWIRIQEVFHNAVELPSGERTAFLDRVCGSDTELRREIEGLIAADSLPDDPAEAAVVSAAEELTADPTIGKRIGPYTITSLIGRGGMGAVYRAVRQDDFRMEVAIKLVQGGADREESLRRFLQERQILAELRHPNIARLLDGGAVGSSRVDLQACKLEYSIVSPK